jgi:hypothetical protein
MLRKDISIYEYISEAYLEFPIFCRHFYEMLQDYYMKGKEIVQVEPYMEKLFRIYEMFSQGKGPSDVRDNPELRRVYEAESKASGALIDFYEATMGSPFNSVVDAVKKFAHTDAERFLRDEVRAEEIKGILPHGKSVLVEGGAIHLYLEKCLRDVMGNEYLIESKSFIEPLVADIKRQMSIAPGEGYVNGRGLR